MRYPRTLTALLVMMTTTLSGCVSFSGPNDVRRQIARSENVDLEKEEGISVGPVGVFLANTLAGSYLPVDLDGVSSVDFGEYTVRARSVDGPDTVRLRDLELPGWEPVVRVRERGSNTLIMVNEGGNKVRGMLFLQSEGRNLQIVRARGDFERILDNVMESELMGDFGGRQLLGRADTGSGPPLPPGERGWGRGGSPVLR